MFYNFAAALVRLFFRIMFNIEIEGLENVPKSGAYVIAPNHLSNFDPPVLGSFLPVRMAYMAKDTLFKVPLFGKLITLLGAFPVRKGGNDLSAIKTAIKVLKSGKQLVIFPEGQRSRTPGVLSEGKQGAVMVAIKAGVGIFPVGINATYKFRSKVVVKVGKYIDLSEYHGRKVSGEEMQKITDELIMPAISNLSGAKLYGN